MLCYPNLTEEVKISSETALNGELKIFLTSCGWDGSGFWQPIEENTAYLNPPGGELKLCSQMNRALLFEKNHISNNLRIHYFDTTDEP